MSERRNLLIAILVAFVFGIAGGVIGTLGTIAVAHHQGGRPFFAGGGGRHDHGPMGRGPRGARGPREHGRPRMEAVLDRELDLTDEQRARIEEILDSARPRYTAVRESTRAQIDRVLTEEQRAKWKELEERFPARRRQRAAP